MDGTKRLDMTAGELTATLVAMLCMGVLAGWGMFGQPRLFARAIEASGPAEWFGAFGTWVIGFMAYKYARDAHTLRTREVAEKADEDTKRRRGAINDLKLRLLMLSGVPPRLKATAIRTGEDTIGPCYYGLRGSQIDLQSFSLDTVDKLFFTEEVFDRLIVIQAHHVVLRARIEDRLNAWARINNWSDAAVTEEDWHEIDYLNERGQKLRTALQDLIDVLEDMF